MIKNKKTLGLAFSGGGNRTSFYVGFLEVLIEKKIQIDYLVAMSGGSLVSASFACGTLEKFKNWMLKLEAKDIKKLILNESGSGGWYSLEKVEDELRAVFTKGKSFEEVMPHMSFVAVDIESGELVDLCMGDIARAACTSCVLPGIFKPVLWGRRSLVDGGILSQVPISSLKKFSPDVMVGINMRGTKNIFPPRLLSFKKVFNYLKKLLFVDNLQIFLENYSEKENSSELPKTEGLFSVLGKSLDVVLKANKNAKMEEGECDLLIMPNKLKISRGDFSKKVIHFYYYEGRKCAEENLEKILKLLEI
jgi:NTE family protein